MRKLGVLLAAGGLLGNAQDPREIIRRSVELAGQNARLTRNYTFLERTNAIEFDGKGRQTDREVVTHDLTILEGSPYRRLVARDDKPLPPKDEQKEEQKLRKITERRRKETPQQRAKRLADYEKKREQEREILREIPDAFDFRLLGDEKVDGRDLYVLDVKPHRGYQPRSKTARYFPKLQGKAWIDKENYSWVKVEAEVIDTISFGGFLVRLGKGAHLTFEQTHVNNEVWLPKRVQAAGAARIALVKKLHGEVEVTYSNYRKFQADSRIVSVETVP